MLEFHRSLKPKLLGTGLQRYRGKTEGGMEKAIFELDSCMPGFVCLGLLCERRRMVVICLVGPGLLEKEVATTTRTGGGLEGGGGVEEASCLVKL